MVNLQLKVLLILSIVAVIGCTRTSTATPTIPASAATNTLPVDIYGLTAENFFSYLKKAMTRPGFFFHTSSAFVGYRYGDTVSTHPHWTADIWVDVARGLARSEFLKDPTSSIEIDDRVTNIVTGEAIYTSVGSGAQKGKLRPCPVVDAPPIVTIGCQPFLEAKGGKVETDLEYEGRPAVALIYEESRKEKLRSPPEELENLKITTGFYVDRRSFLPLAWVRRFKDDNEQLLWGLVATYKNEFAQLGSLPSDFFDPASIGYVKKDPTAPVNDPDLGVTVYWLGREIAPPGDLPQMALREVYRAQGPGQGPGDRLTLDYKPGDGLTLDHKPGLRLQLWQPQEWQRFLETPLGRLWWDSPCVKTKEVSLEHGRAVIFMGYEPEVELPPGPVAVTPFREEAPAGSRPLASTPIVRPSPTPGGVCPKEPFDRFVAHVYLGDTVVAVNAPHCLFCVARRHEPDPYDTMEGMEAVIKGLRPRSAGE